MNFDFLLERFRAKLYDQKQENNHHVEYFKECLQIIIRKMFKVPMKQNTFAEVDKIIDLPQKKYRKAEQVQCHVCFVNVQSCLHENVVFSVCACVDNAAYIIFIIWNSISGLYAWYHFRFNISCGVAVTVRSYQKNFR